jgi:hypothetical protein
LITLTDRIPWSIQIGGGAANQRLDLRHLQLSKLQISGGANRLDAQLPAPKGTVLIDVSGGASNVTLRAPAHSEWRVAVSGGVSAVTVNGSSSGLRHRDQWGRVAHRLPDRLRLIPWRNRWCWRATGKRNGV